jgi:hypothetical protein
MIPKLSVSRSHEPWFALPDHNTGPAKGERARVPKMSVKPDMGLSKRLSVPA